MYVKIIPRSKKSKIKFKNFEVDIVYPHPYGTVQWIGAGVTANITIMLKGKLDDYIYDEEKFKEGYTGLWIRKKKVKGVNK